MRMYKVLFEQNKAIAAMQIDFSNHPGLKIDYDTGRRDVKWVVVYADDELEGIKVADKIVSGIGVQNNKKGLVIKKPR